MTIKEASGSWWFWIAVVAVLFFVGAFGKWQIGNWHSLSLPHAPGTVTTQPVSLKV